MSVKTSIQWCDSTVNPVMGCSGCELWNDNQRSCYAGQLHNLRRNHTGFSPDFTTPKLFPGRMEEAASWSDLGGKDRDDKPWLNEMPRMIFVSDMGDALSENEAIDSEDKPIVDGAVPFEFLKSEIIDSVFSENGQRHNWLWLTKRPGRLKEFADWLRLHHDLDLPRNLWIGTSITASANLPRISQLVEIGDENTIRFVSAEPLWEEVSLSEHLDGIGWVICGGESRQGNPAREFRCEWARNLLDECQDAGIPIFVKQLGANVSDGGTALDLNDSHGGEWDEWPEDLRIRDVPTVEQYAVEIVPEDLDSLAENVRAEHQQFVGAFKTSLNHARKAGMYLLKARKEIQSTRILRWHGWIQEKCGIAIRTAQVYMRIAEHWDELITKAQQDAPLTLREANRLLSKSKPKVTDGEDTAPDEPALEPDAEDNAASITETYPVSIEGETEVSGSTEIEDDANDSGDSDPLQVESASSTSEAEPTFQDESQFYRIVIDPRNIIFGIEIVEIAKETNTFLYDGKNKRYRKADVCRSLREALHQRHQQLTTFLGLFQTELAKKEIEVKRLKKVGEECIERLPIPDSLRAPINGREVKQ